MTKYLTPKKYEALPDDQKLGWTPQYKTYDPKVSQEMQYCDCCGHELGLEDVTTYEPVGEPYRYAWTIGSELQAYYSKRLLDSANAPNAIMKKSR